MSRDVKPGLEAEEMVRIAKATLLVLGGTLEFIALLLLSLAYSLLAGAVSAFPPPDVLRSAYSSASWGFLLAALGFPLLVGGFAIRRQG